MPSRTSTPRTLHSLSAAIALATGTVAGCGGRATTAVDGGALDQGFSVAKHQAAPVLAKSKDGVIIKNPRLVTVVAANDDLGPQLVAFSDAMMTPKGKWWTSFASEYGVGDPAKNVTVTGPMIMGSSMTEDQMTTYVTNATVGNSPEIDPDGSTVYLLYLPLGTTFYYQGSTNDNCGSVPGGYHLPYLGMGDVLVPIMRCLPARGQQQIDQLTTVASGQVAAAVTDPVNGTGWVISSAGDAMHQVSAWANTATWMMQQFAEAPDLCTTSSRFTDGTNVFQRVYSNKAAASGGDPCVPALAVPYFSASTELPWYGGGAGTQLTIDVTGWSTSALDPWPVRAVLGPVVPSDTTDMATVRISAGTNVTVAGITYQTIGNGTTAKLTVNLPMLAMPGWWQIIYLRSFHLDSGGAPPAGEDLAHVHAVGVFTL